MHRCCQAGARVKKSNLRICAHIYMKIDYFKSIDISRRLCEEINPGLIHVGANEQRDRPRSSANWTLRPMLFVKTQKPLRQNVNTVISAETSTCSRRVWWEICEWNTVSRVFVVRCDALLRAANPVAAGNVQHAETKPMAHHIAKTSARRGQSVGGMQTRNFLRQALNVK